MYASDALQSTFQQELTGHNDMYIKNSAMNFTPLSLSTDNVAKNGE